MQKERLVFTDAAERAIDFAGQKALLLQGCLSLVRISFYRLERAVHWVSNRQSVTRYPQKLFPTTLKSGKVEAPRRHPIGIAGWLDVEDLGCTSRQASDMAGWSRKKGQKDRS
jgi:hypothetical protein